ncbi:hypothetical protein GGR01_003801 [Acetobacter oeni]|nr:hypothetical protein [Acetobacter oeni]
MMRVEEHRLLVAMDDIDRVVDIRRHRIRRSGINWPRPIASMP